MVHGYGNSHTNRDLFARGKLLTDVYGFSIASMSSQILFIEFLVLKEMRYSIMLRNFPGPLSIFHSHWQG